MTVAARRRLLRPALAAALALATQAAPASAATPLDRPPTLYTFKLDDAGARLSLLRSHFDAAVERPGPYNRYVGGPYGRWSKEPWISLAWGRAAEPTETEETTPSSVRLPLGSAVEELSPAFGFEQPADDLRMPLSSQHWITRLFVAGEEPPFWTTGPSLHSNGFDALWAPPAKPVVDWRCRRRPVLFIRHGGESDRLLLVRCNGSVEPGAVDRLSILARPPEVPDPGALPDEPDPDAWEKGEWLPRVKLVNPRLLWVLQKIADAFPHRAIYVYSGYRPHVEKAGGQGHQSKHAEGRAMDIQVHGVRNESLFQFCRKLEDVGCGFYPNSKFVHVDVRRPGTGYAFWIDISGPGEASHYVDSWPGVVESGALAWMAVPAKNGPSQLTRPRTPDERGTADVIRK
jgi:Peptidase M15